MMATKTDLSPVAEAICGEKGFKLMGKVGEGAFKETFHVVKGEQESVALKIFYGGASPQRQTREITAMTRCDHPSIAKFYGVFHSTVNGTGYTWTLEEFLDGGTLGKRIQEMVLETTEVGRIAKHLCEGVSHIASLALVHRDLKPDNIMFKGGLLLPVIVDFGLVRDLAGVSVTSSWVMQGPGTPFFSAPEQLNNDKALIDWRSDQFGLGVTLAMAAFQTHPYADPDTLPDEVVQRVANREQQSEHFTQIAGEAGLGVLIKMTRKWPIQRFRTPQDLIEAWK